jgi:hypothetical protein
MKDLRGQIERMAKFLGKTLTDEQLIKLTSHLHINNFENNQSVNMEDVRKDGVAMINNRNDLKFIRKG